METKKPTKILKIEAFELAMDYVKSHSGVSVEKPDFKEWYEYFLNELQDSADYEQRQLIEQEKPLLEGKYVVFLNKDLVKENAIHLKVNYGTGILCQNIIPENILFDFIKNYESYEKKSV